LLPEPIDPILRVGMGREQAVVIGISLVPLHQFRQEGPETRRVVPDLVREPDALVVRVILIAAVESLLDDVVVRVVGERIEILAAAHRDVGSELHFPALLDRFDRVLLRNVFNLVGEHARELRFALD
jgi:hypothetical protein